MAAIVGTDQVAWELVDDGEELVACGGRCLRGFLARFSKSFDEAVLHAFVV